MSAPGAPATEEPEAPVEEVAETQEAEGEETDQAAPAATESPTQEAINIHKRQPCTGEKLVDQNLYALSSMPGYLAMIAYLVENDDPELRRKVLGHIQPILDEILDPDSETHSRVDPDHLIEVCEWDQLRKKRSQAQPEEVADELAKEDDDGREGESGYTPPEDFDQVSLSHPVEQLKPFMGEICTFYNNLPIEAKLSVALIQRLVEHEHSFSDKWIGNRILRRMENDVMQFEPSNDTDPKLTKLLGFALPLIELPA